MMLLLKSSLSDEEFLVLLELKKLEDLLQTVGQMGLYYLLHEGVLSARLQLLRACREHKVASRWQAAQSRSCSATKLGCSQMQATSRWSSR